jgi:hypothetical protein
MKKIFEKISYIILKKFQNHYFKNQKQVGHIHRINFLTLKSS